MAEPTMLIPLPDDMARLMKLTRWQAAEIARLRERVFELETDPHGGDLIPLAQPRGGDLRRQAERCIVAWTVVRSAVWDPNGLMDEHMAALRKALGPNVRAKPPEGSALERVVSPLLEKAMERTKYPLSHEWHVAVNRHSEEWRKAGKDWGDMRFMYEAKTMADEVPRMAMLFKAEREGALPQTHQQCSMQAPVPVHDNHLTCCRGVKARECPHLLALEKIERCTPDDVDAAKAWTCAAHIVSTGGDHMGEGYMLRVDDRMFWDAVHESLAQTDEG